MNQRPFSPVTGEAFKVENYYFQIILQRLIPKRTPNPGNVQYTFTPFKGAQKYQSSKAITLQLGSDPYYPLENAKVNFVAISYNPSKSLSFAIRMVENTTDKDKQVGEYLLDANNYIDHFMQSENGAFTLKLDFNDDWAAQVQLYVERTRYGLERLVREIKNPKPKENGDAVPLSHQSIKEQRKKLDLEEEKEEEEAPHHQHYKKFSPRRESHEDANKKTQYFSRKHQEPPKKEPQVEPPKKEEKKKSPKAEFVPKKEWIIPEAEKYMASKTKSSSRTNSLHNAKAAEEKQPSVVKSEKEQPRRRPKVVEQPSFLEKLPIQPKYLVLVAIAVAILLAFSFFRSEPTPAQTAVKGPKNGKPKKAEKVEKVKAKGKK